jgi:NAD(P)-dependent dehydrogenase (short-subunit alcohol dehydrogenase family)
MEIDGRIALVTGGASGLGLATAEALRERGAEVVLLDRDAEAVEREARRLGARAVAGDVRSEQDVRRALSGGVDIAVSCAGIGGPARVVGRDGAPLELEHFRRIVEVNLLGTFNVIRLAAAAMAATPGEGEERGVLVNTASVAAFEGQIGQVSYAASKGGIVGLTLPVARDLASHRIRCVTIAPGMLDTPLLRGLEPAVRERLAAAVPHPRRLGRPEEFAALACHVVENALLNGEVIRLDGALRLAPR